MDINMQTRFFAKNERSGRKTAPDMKQIILYSVYSVLLLLLLLLSLWSGLLSPLSILMHLGWYLWTRFNYIHTATVIYF